MAFRNIFQLLFLILILPMLASSGAFASKPQGMTEGYKVHQTVRLKKRVDGIDGSLQLLEDERVTPELRRGMWHGYNDPLLSLEGRVSKDDPLLRSFKDLPVRSARLRLVDGRGKSLDEQTFDAPLGKIEKSQLRLGATAIHMVTIDNSIGWGSYAGPTMHLVAVSKGKLAQQSAVDDETGERSEIRLVSAIRSGWRLIDRPGRRYPEILAVSCRVDPAISKGGDYGVTIVEFTRILRRGAAWRRRRRWEAGCWENEEGNEIFPPISKFPPR